MSNIVETPDEVQKHYDMLLPYLEELKAYAADPSSPPGEFSDQLEELDLEPLIRVIQARITHGASSSEAAILYAFRDFDSMLEEYAMRQMTRESYYTDRVLESEETIIKVQADVANILALLGGNDISQR